MTQDTILAVRNLEVVYSDVILVLRGVSIDVPKGAIVDSVVQCLGQAPPELAQDLIVQGIHLVGGGGMLRGLDRRLAQETAIPVHLVDAPLECVVLGAGKCLESFDSLKVMFMGAER